MKIEDIGGRKVKVGRTSITVKGDNGKTCGVVSGITKFADLRPNKQVDYWHKLKQAGIWGCGIDGIMDCVLYTGDQLYYLNNISPLRMYEEHLAGLGMDYEDKRYQKRLKIAEAAKEIAVVIDCKVLS